MVHINQEKVLENNKMHSEQQLITCSIDTWRASLVALVVKNLPPNAGNGRGFDPRVGKIPWRRAWQPTPVFLPGESMDRGAWRATVHGVTESYTTEET